ncbi:MAG: hypothetical protein M0D57_09775 [Sphingobacteriales bacterium JAD_PAG50586_3]|nr:MAG: hypothetical protein M0D57_09775 [Sphingobacteriales bacterium JAD_PAG50586_3]
MKLLPAQEIIYKTNLTEEEAIERITLAVIPTRSLEYRLPANMVKRKYSGDIYGPVFKIQRKIGYRNSFLPQITGTIKEEPTGTVVNVSMQMHSFVNTFLLIYISIPSAVFITWLVAILAGGEFSLGVFIPFLFIGFAMLISHVGFNYEATTARIDLKKIFEAEIVSQTN